MCNRKDSRSCRLILFRSTASGKDLFGTEKTVCTGTAAGSSVLSHTRRTGSKTMDEPFLKSSSISFLLVSRSGLLNVFRNLPAGMVAEPPIKLFQSFFVGDSQFFSALFAAAFYYRATFGRFHFLSETVTVFSFRSGGLVSPFHKNPFTRLKNRGHKDEKYIGLCNGNPNFLFLNRLLL